MVIDGAMGTMIQQHNLDEDAFRGMLSMYMSGNYIFFEMNRLDRINHHAYSEVNLM